MDHFDDIDRALLDGWQREFPLSHRPFQTIGSALGIGEDTVMSRYARLLDDGQISRIGATCAPNTVSASTLAAVAAPEDQIEEIAALINEEDGVNHSYLREDTWNIWFVMTGPDRTDVDAALERISERTGLRVLDLRLVRPFNIDLGFKLTGKGEAMPPARKVDRSVLTEGDRPIMAALSSGMPLSATPYIDLATELDRDEEDLLARIRILQDARLISRLGVIVRHRKLGWSSNAMVVWDVDADQIGTIGPKLAAQKGVTLCYERRPVADVWPWRLYTMFHAKSREVALENIERAASLPELSGTDRKVLFSTRCFKQKGALIDRARNTEVPA
ncbi:transcriptional regulator, AsnC family [Aliiroseovarius crassostreae]|uniref:siroheme decarboxylase n=1 Tax=Aliiroseovarius crassostreae TaxID=154981 RepID=A0A0N8IB09_9RHOB|nr:AsnC family transcriptional regulator [Aliiroseovarius crassostreae]KPN61795.1 protein nirD [Aliiroseovarius crassostreae]SFU46823.1 transcriptional regulator, AsnC family [Aliiroseovarius crassostreae]